jgi:hypothetical protein
MGEIFFSYAREDASRVEVLARCLENHGWSVFWDRRIPSGKQWHDVLSAALARADWVIVAWSAASLKSGFVRDEAQVGLERNRLLPVLLDDVRPPLGFGQVQAANLTAFDGDEGSPAFQTLLRDLGAPADIRRISTGATAKSIPDVTAGPPRTQPKGRKWALIAGFVTLLAAVVVWIAIRSVPPKPDASAVATGNLPVSASASASTNANTPTATPSAPASAPIVERNPPELETERVLALLRGYYTDLNAGTFQASRYFAPSVSRFITMQNTTAKAIQAYVTNVLPKTYTTYRADMDETTLTRTDPRTFTYLETTSVMQKNQKRTLSARVTVQLVRVPGIRMVDVPAPGIDRREPHGATVWKLSSFETSSVKRVAPH